MGRGAMVRRGDASGGKRSLTSAVASIEDLLMRKPLYEDEMEEGRHEEPTRCGTSHSSDGEASGRPPQKQARLEPSRCSSSAPLPSLEASCESPNSTLSLGGTELELLHRKEEERADMALFLATAVARLQTGDNLCELLECFSREGCDAMLLALKLSGTLGAFFDALWPVRFTDVRGTYVPGGEEAEKALLQFLLLLVRKSELDVLCCRPVVAALVSRLSTPGPEQRPPGEGTGGSSALPSPLHWSERGRRRRAGDASSAAESPSSSELAARLTTGRCSPALLGRLENVSRSLITGTPLAEGGAGVDSCTDVAGLSLAILLELVLRQNERSGEFMEGTCVARVFAAQGGFTHVARMLSAHAAGAFSAEPALRRLALSFLEVVTASNRLGAEPTIAGVAETLVAALSDDTQRGPDLHRLFVLRVLTNITGITPSLLSSNARQQLGVTLRRLLDMYLEVGTSTDDGGAGFTDEAIFSLCCAVNVLKWERREACLDFTNALLCNALNDNDGSMDDGSRDLLHTLAVAMLKNYKGAQTEDVVRSGYDALFLGVVSLARHPMRDDGSYRVPVITALAAAARDTDMGVSSVTKPMKIVVAILQEFLLFQSTSGTLTRSALAEMNAILEALVYENNIELTSQ